MSSFIEDLRLLKMFDEILYEGIAVVNGRLTMKVGWYFINKIHTSPFEVKGFYLFWIMVKNPMANLVIPECGGILIIELYGRGIHLLSAWCILEKKDSTLQRCGGSLDTLQLRGCKVLTIL
jgi:hypothetical protein